MSRPLQVDLVVPVVQLLGVDLLAPLLGRPLGEIVSHLLRGPQRVERRAGRLVDVYPLAIPDGEGASIGGGGTLTDPGWEVGFAARGGALALRVPVLARRALEGWPDDRYVSPPTAVGRGAVEAVITLPAGSTIGLPFGRWSIALVVPPP